MAPRSKLTYPHLFATLVRATNQQPIGCTGWQVFCTATHKPIGVLWRTDDAGVWYYRIPGVTQLRWETTQALAVAGLREAAVAAGSHIRAVAPPPPKPRKPRPPKPAPYGVPALTGDDWRAALDARRDALLGAYLRLVDAPDTAPPAAPRTRPYPAHKPHTRHRTLVPYAPRNLDPEPLPAVVRHVVWGAKREAGTVTAAVGQALVDAGLRPGIDLHGGRAPRKP